MTRTHYQAAHKASSRGALLLESVIALAIFVSVGLSVSVAMRTGFGAAIDMRNQAIATDIARSAVAQIRAGIAEPDDLDGPVPLDEYADSTEFVDTLVDSDWLREIETDRSGYAGLTRLTVTVRHHSDPSIQITMESFIQDSDGLAEAGR